MTPKERLASLGPPPSGRGGMSEFALYMKPSKLLELLEAQRNDALEEASNALECFAEVWDKRVRPLGTPPGIRGSEARSFAHMLQVMKT